MSTQIRLASGETVVVIESIDTVRVKFGMATNGMAPGPWPDFSRVDGSVVVVSPWQAETVQAVPEEQ